MNHSASRRHWFWRRCLRLQAVPRAGEVSASRPRESLRPRSPCGRCCMPRCSMSMNCRRTCASLPSAAPWRRGIPAALPPPPWCAATRRLAASSAKMARSCCLCRRARRCHACSPVVLTTTERAGRWRRRGARSATESGEEGPAKRGSPTAARSARSSGERRGPAEGRGWAPGGSSRPAPGLPSGPRTAGTHPARARLTLAAR